MKDVRRRYIDLITVITARRIYVSAVLKALKKILKLLGFVYARTVGVI